ncbi:hypothetical protein [Polycladidibacter hongkongensis]|uniref:hypothetical protein n=1 Tax=Polycladidibacter hongkongensis TaxID=1647556 RepID=UPI000834FB9D|nr:hypothetical protein [Pseudovibrio hongkongensis]
MHSQTHQQAPLSFPYDLGERVYVSQLRATGIVSAICIHLDGGARAQVEVRNIAKNTGEPFLNTYWLSAEQLAHPLTQEQQRIAAEAAVLNAVDAPAEMTAQTMGSRPLVA